MLPIRSQPVTKAFPTRALDRTGLADTGNCDHDPASDSEIDRANPEAQRSAAQREPIDAIYTLDDNWEPCGARPVTSLTQPVPFDPKVMYRVYFEENDTPYKSEWDLAQPHAHIFMQSDGQRCIEYTFLPFTSAEEVEWLEQMVKTREFLSPALKRWGLFRLFRGGSSLPQKQLYHQGANMLVDYWNGAGAAYLRRVGVPSAMTFADVLSDYLFLRDVVSRMLRRLKGDQPMRKQKQEETISAQTTDTGDTKVTIDIEQAMEEFKRLAEVKDGQESGVASDR